LNVTRRKRLRCASVLGIFSFDVERSMFDVHLSKNKNLFSAFEVHNLG